MFNDDDEEAGREAEEEEYNILDDSGGSSSQKPIAVISKKTKSWVWENFRKSFFMVVMPVNNHFPYNCVFFKKYIILINLNYKHLATPLNAVLVPN